MQDGTHNFTFAIPVSSVDEPIANMGRVIPLSVEDACYAVRFKYRVNPRWAGQQQVEILGYMHGGVVEPFGHIPYEDDSFAWLTRHFLDADDDVLVAVMRGGLQSISPEAIREVNTLAVIGPVWCSVATLRTERPYGPGGQEVKRGSKHFKPGAKLYLVEVMSWLARGAKRDVQVEVVGRHRGSHRYVTMVVSASWLTNWRVDLIYSPHVIAELWPNWDGTQTAKGRAQEMVGLMRARYDSSSMAPPND